MLKEMFVYETMPEFESSFVDYSSFLKHKNGSLICFLYIVMLPAGSMRMESKHMRRGKSKIHKKLNEQSTNN